MTPKSWRNHDDEYKELAIPPTTLELASLARAMKAGGITEKGMMIYRRLCMAYEQYRDKDKK